MDIQWMQSPNFAVGRKGYKPMAIFFHIEAGTEGGTQNWFKNPASQVSAHYSISKQGEITQYVKEEDTAWAVGRVTNPSWEFYKQGVNPNLTTISIENEGYPQDGFTDAQVETNIWLAAEICKRWDIDVSNETVESHQRLCGHYQLDPISRHQCPGDKFPWQRVIDGVKAKLYGNEEWTMEEKQLLKDVAATLAGAIKELHVAQDEINELKKVIAYYENQTIAPWAKEAMDKAVAKGLIKGDEMKNLNPNKPLTRQEFVTILDRIRVL